MKKTNIFVVAAAASMIAGVAAAQTLGATPTGTQTADDVRNLERQIEDDARRTRVGNAGRTVGTYGSVALRATSLDRNGGTDVTTVGVGVNYGFYDGVNGSEFNLSYVYSDSSDPASTDNVNTVTASYDYTRDFSPRLFGYAAIDIKSDQEADTAVAGDISKDAFIGFGIGYRVIDTPQVSWAIKAGPGYRAFERTPTPPTVPGTFEKIDEVAYSAESNFSYSFSDTVYVSNDTTIIGSDALSTVKNDLALNVAMSNALSLRTSYISEFNGADLGSLDNSENTFGVSVVYNFN